MSKTHSRYRGLTAGVLVALRPEERTRLRQLLFDRGNVSMQSFFRQVALAEIRGAEMRHRQEGACDGADQD
jgi:hypothetical protein